MCVRVRSTHPSVRDGTSTLSLLALSSRPEYLSRDEQPRRASPVPSNSIPHLSHTRSFNRHGYVEDLKENRAVRDGPARIVPIPPQPPRRYTSHSKRALVRLFFGLIGSPPLARRLSPLSRAARERPRPKRREPRRKGKKQQDSPTGRESFPIGPGRSGLLKFTPYTRNIAHSPMRRVDQRAPCRVSPFPPRTPEARRSSPLSERKISNNLDGNASFDLIIACFAFRIFPRSTNASRVPGRLRNNDRTFLKSRKQGTR